MARVINIGIAPKEVAIKTHSRKLGECDEVAGRIHTLQRSESGNDNDPKMTIISIEPALGVTARV